MRKALVYLLALLLCLSLTGTAWAEEYETEILGDFVPVLSGGELGGESSAPGDTAPAGDNETDLSMEGSASTPMPTAPPLASTPQPGANGAYVPEEIETELSTEGENGREQDRPESPGAAPTPSLSARPGAESPRPTATPDTPDIPDTAGAPACTPSPSEADGASQKQARPSGLSVSIWPVLVLGAAVLCGVIWMLVRRLGGRKK